MTKIKLCGLSSLADIKAVNALKPDYIGFVFAEKSKRCVSMQEAAALKARLSNDIKAVGVFVNSDLHTIVNAVENGIIDIIQLHGSEDAAYIQKLKKHTNAPVIKAYVITTLADAEKARQSAADFILLDGGKGEGKVFDWSLLKNIDRPYFLAGGLNPENVTHAIRTLAPFAADVSSGIETDGKKDINKMTAFVKAVRRRQI